MCIPVVLFFLSYRIQPSGLSIPAPPPVFFSVPHPSLPFIRLKEVHFLKITIQGVSFDDLTLAQAVMTGAELARTDGFHYVVTPNPEFVMLAQRDPEFQTLLNQADLTIPDGIGIIYAAKLLAPLFPAGCRALTLLPVSWLNSTAAAADGSTFWVPSPVLRRMPGKIFLSAIRH